MNPRDARAAPQAAGPRRRGLAPRPRAQRRAARHRDRAPGQVFVPFHYAEGQRQPGDAERVPIRLARAELQAVGARARTSRSTAAQRRVATRNEATGRRRQRHGRGWPASSRSSSTEQRFAITVFGDETHVNYNRIMLSSVLAGEKAADDIVINPRRVVSPQRDRPARRRPHRRRRRRCQDGHRRRRQRHAVRHAAAGHRQLAWMPPIEGLDKDGVFAFRTLDDTRALLRSSAPA